MIFSGSLRYAENITVPCGPDTYCTCRVNVDPFLPSPSNETLHLFGGFPIRHTVGLDMINDWVTAPTLAEPIAGSPHCGRGGTCESMLNFVVDLCKNFHDSPVRYPTVSFLSNQSAAMALSLSSNSALTFSRLSSPGPVRTQKLAIHLPSLRRWSPP